MLRTLARRVLRAPPVRSCARQLCTSLRPVTSGATGVYSDAPSPLQEFSVVYTDRALNHMSEPFKKVMLDMNDILKEVYHAEHAVIIPGSGSYGMEAVARQFGTGKKVLVLRNGFFSFRWTQIFEQCGITDDVTVLKARAVDDHPTKAQYAPCPIDEVVATILAEKPACVFAPQVETSTGIIIPDWYIQQVSEAVHSYGGLVVLDCIASGTVFANMEELGVDALISAPQKGWTGPACAALVMLSKHGAEVTRNTQSTSFVCNLRKWLELMDAYEAGGFMYHATMPTDALVVARDLMEVTREMGYATVEAKAWELGKLVRGYMCKERGLISVAAPGFESPGVVVVHSDDSAIAGKFATAGTQIAAGVPFMIGEPEGTQTFRIGLFGIDKLKDPPATLENLRRALDAALPPAPEQIAATA